MATKVTNEESIKKPEANWYASQYDEN